jgi:diguanylate cyclase (GGDEF)-like protein
VRGTDLVARYGGEEFVLILPETTLTQACALAERLRATIEGLTIALPNGARLSVTISFGASAYPETSETGESLIVDADAAMNRAKEMGRNRVCKATATATLLLVE